MDWNRTTSLRLICGPGLAPAVQQEVEALGHDVGRVERTGLELRGTMHDAMRLNLHLRTALTVLYELKSFTCNSPDELYDVVRAGPWEDIIPVDGYLTVTSRVDHPSINNSMFPNMRVKDAIVDRITERKGRRPDSGPRRDRVVVNLYWYGRRARISLDTSGQKLADRGYRKMPGSAPMQEALAAGVMIRTGYDGSQVLLNPMCGSGTLAIEAALIAANRAPGLLRGNFSFMHLCGFDENAWGDLRAAARKATRKRAQIAPIIASDIDPQAVDAAQRNATTAGVEHLIEFDTCDFAKTPIPDAFADGGMVVMNPEYGLRLGDEAKLADTYGRIGDFLKQRCAGGTGFVFTGNLPLAKRVGLRTSQRTTFFNAEVECRLLRYDLYAGTRKEKSSGL